MPGLHQPVTSHHVREAVKLLRERDRVAVQQHLARGGTGCSTRLPPAPEAPRPLPLFNSGMPLSNSLRMLENQSASGNAVVAKATVLYYNSKAVRH